MKGSFTARTTLSIAAWDAGPEIDPAEPASVEDISIRIFNTKTKAELFCPTWLHNHFADDDAFQNWLLSEAADRDECAREDAAERRHEERTS